MADFENTPAQLNEALNNGTNETGADEAADPACYEEKYERAGEAADPVRDEEKHERAGEAGWVTL